MKKLFIGTIIIIVLAVFCYGVYYYLTISSFNVVNDTVVISTTESYQIDVYTSDEKNMDPLLYTYTSDDEKIATVDERGRILSVSEGDTYVTVKRGFKSFRIKVTVYEKEKKQDGNNDQKPAPVSSNSNSNSNKEVRVTGITIPNNNVTMKTGDSLRIEYVISPDNATNKNVTFSVDKPDVISINNGVVIAKSNGIGTVLVTTVDGNYVAKCTITVSSNTVNVTGISATINKSILVVGEKGKITVNVTPKNASNKTLTYKSSNPQIASVDVNGNVTGVSSGTATITISTTDGSKKKATVSVTVKNPVHATSVNITGASEVAVGGTIKLSFTTVPANAVEKTVTWSSSNTAVATVNENGVVTGKSAGTVIIYATLANGAKNGKTITIK